MANLPKMTSDDATNKGLIAWFARNSVAANLLMLFIIIGGLLTAGTISKQMFPQVEINWLKVGVAYPSAAPQEVEEGITLKIEQALESVQGLDRIITESYRGYSAAYVRVAQAYEPQVVLEEVKAQIDAISSFPDGMEKVQVTRIKYRQEVMYISLYGELEHQDLKALGLNIHKEIQQLPSVNISDFYSGLGYEISIEVSKDKLREYNLTFQQVAGAIRQSSRNMSAGQIRAENGYINLRVENQAYRGYQFENIPVLTLADGSQVLLGDVARVDDGLWDGIQYSKFNGQNSVSFFIGAASDQDITNVAEVVKKFIAEKQHELPEGVNLETWVDLTYYLEGRLNMMIDNMKSGAVLVFLMLALFLRIRLAFWVMMGLPVCFLGTLFLMPTEMVSVTINITSLFAFILVLGIVVDDAIVMGESAHAEIEKSGHSPESVIRGVQRVAMPATFGVLTTIAAFIPFLMGDGPESAVGKAIGGVVILCLIFSLIESKLILPAHLVKMKVKPENSNNVLDRLRSNIDRGVKHVIHHFYQPLITKCVHYRYGVLAFFISILLISAGLFNGGILRYVGQPKIPHDFPRINIQMNLDSAEQATLNTVQTVESILANVEKQIVSEYGKGMTSDIQVDLRGKNRAQIMVKLVDENIRPISPFELAERWRTAIPQLPGVERFEIQENIFGNDRDSGDIGFRLESLDDRQLLAAAKALKVKLKSMQGVGDVNDSRETSSKEIQFTLKPLAYSLGLTLADIASQVGYSFYGLEAQRILRDGEEIKVMVRYPNEERNAMAHVDDVVIIAKNGTELPLSEVADIHVKQGVSNIRRENGNRTINIWGNVDASQVEPFKLAQDIRDNFIPQLLREYPLVKSEVTGRIQEEIDSANEQSKNFILSLLVIFTLLAVPLKSYSQPIMIMTVIPFGVIGATLGHVLLGMDLNNFSIFGIIAASGVVVNDSLVMVDYINKTRLNGVKLSEAVIHAGCQRFRAILLTSITTFIGLVPIMLETSLQAQMVIPMAVSLAFGVLFATVVTLILIPSLYIIIEDIKGVFSRFRLFKKVEKRQIA
ncbi:efflux RND transporter permease subunit [Thalassotalea agariperforans]